MGKRDDFSEETKRKLGEQVNLVCSNPGCRAPTKGPNEDDDKSTSVGKACHIHAAAPGGPRYDPNQTDEERKSINNGIWLCAVCSDKIDRDWKAYPASLLYEWKEGAKREAAERLGKPRASVQPPSRTDEVRDLRFLVHLVEQVRGRVASDAAFMARVPGTCPSRYDTKPIDELLSRLPRVLEDARVVRFTESLSTAIAVLSRLTPSEPVTEPLRQIGLHAGDLLAVLNVHLKCLDIPVIVREAPEPVRPLRRLQLTLVSEPVAMVPPYPPYDRHRLLVNVKNVSDARIHDWTIEIEFPVRLIEPGVRYTAIVAERSKPDVAFFRFAMNENLYPGDTHPFNILYRLDRSIRAQHRNAIRTVFVRSLVDGVRDAANGGHIADIPGSKWKL